MTEYQDRQDISDVLIRYASGIDGRDWALFRTVFTADCDVDYGDIGHWRSVEEITDFMDRAHAMAGRCAGHSLGLHWRKLVTPSSPAPGDPEAHPHCPDAPWLHVAAPLASPPPAEGHDSGAHGDL